MYEYSDINQTCNRRKNDKLLREKIFLDKIPHPIQALPKGKELPLMTSIEGLQLLVDYYALLHPLVPA